MYFVCKIDKDIYSVVTPNIITDEVIITDERILHIKERHPDDYERFVQYLPQIILKPDYIISARKPHTAVILKEIDNGADRFKLVLRLHIETDPVGYKNSIISFWRIGNTTWKKTLKNKPILYKKK